MKEIKAVFFDIDGTLVPIGEKTLSPSTIKTLTKLHENGVLTYIATGRTLTSFLFAYKQFAFDGYLAMNGQYCVHGQDVIRSSHLDKAQIRAIFPFVEAYGITVGFVAKDDLFINQRGKTYREFCHHYPKHDPLDRLERIDTHDIFQMIMYMTREEERDFITRFPYFQMVRWSPCFADVIAHDGGKEVGIAAFCRHLGISRNQVMAFGDGGNDIGMLQYAGIGVAMGNASESVKAVADYVTGDVADDGITQAMQHFHII